VLGGARCSNQGPQDCNPGRNPGGAFCCLSGLCTAQPVRATRYDQTCHVDTDCVSVAEGDPCTACGISCTASATINVGALPQYRSDIANTAAALSAVDGGCLSTCGTVSGRSDYGPFCCDGMCHVGGPCGSGDAGVDAAGNAPDADGSAMSHDLRIWSDMMRSKCRSGVTGTPAATLVGADGAQHFGISVFGASD
jgi:hypothetical protein